MLLKIQKVAGQLTYPSNLLQLLTMVAIAAVLLTLSVAAAVPGGQWPPPSKEAEGAQRPSPTKAITETTTVTATGTSCPSTPPSGPRINVIFFSDANCQNSVPQTVFGRDVFGSVACYNDFPNETYSSLIVDYIDDQIIGTNTALEVGIASSTECDFEHSVKFKVANKDVVDECQFIGIPTGQHKPTVAGNEYRLTNWQ